MKTFGWRRGIGNLPLFWLGIIAGIILYLYVKEHLAIIAATALIGLIINILLEPITQKEYSLTFYDYFRRRKIDINEIHDAYFQKTPFSINATNLQLKTLHGDFVIRDIGGYNNNEEIIELIKEKIGKLD